jgi:uncharacterized C2H2 Zn-finger protein
VTARDWFLYFRCPRCSHIARHAPRDAKGLLLCPACHSRYAVRGGPLFGSLLGTTAAVPYLIVGGVLWPQLARAALDPLWVFIIATPLVLPVMLVAKRYLARYVLRYEYVGRAAS